MSNTDIRNVKGGRLVVGALVILFGGAAATQFATQVVRKNSILDLARGNEKNLKGTVLPARRGEISTVDGHVVAENENSYNVSISYEKCPQTPGFFMEVSRATGIAEAELSYPASTMKYKMWTTDLTPSQLDSLNKVQKEWRADGLVASPVDSRTYPMGEQFSGVVGVVRSGKPVSGLELGFNNLLSGAPGVAYGSARYATFNPPSSREAVNGKDVTLTIDSGLQSLAFDAIKNAVIKHNATRGCAIVLNPKTGDIMAMANYPTYDPDANLNGEGMVSTSYQAALEPGSMFKILTLSEALDKNVIGPGWSTTCTGELDVDGKHSVKCDDHHGNRAHGVVDITRAIAVSCNTSAAKWSLAIGRDRMTKYFDQLGLVGKLGTKLPGEAAGGYYAPDHSRLQLANFGFGQAMVASPLALASAFSMIGNGGILMKPRLIKDLDGQEVPTEARGTIVKKEVADTVLHTMEAVIQSDYGTGADLKIPGFRLAGKTGTAQKIQHGKVVGYVSNFVGFVPANNPKACILVMIDDPKVGYYGAVVAGPVFRDIAKSILRMSAVEPDSSPAMNYALLAPAKSAVPAPIMMPASYVTQGAPTAVKQEQPSVEVVAPATTTKAKRKVVNPQSDTTTIKAAQRVKKPQEEENVPHKYDSEVPRDADPSDIVFANADTKVKRAATHKAMGTESSSSSSPMKTTKPHTKKTVKPVTTTVPTTATAATVKPGKRTGRRVAKAPNAQGETVTSTSPDKAASPFIVKRHSRKASGTSGTQTEKLIAPQHVKVTRGGRAASPKMGAPKLSGPVKGKATSGSESEDVTMNAPQRAVKRVVKTPYTKLPASGKMGGRTAKAATEKTTVTAAQKVKKTVKKPLHKPSPKMAPPAGG